MADILGYVDGFIFVAGGQIRVDWFPNNPVDPTTVPEITEADLTARPSGGGFGDWNQGATSAVVVYKDFDRDYEQAPARYNAPVNGENRLANAVVRIDRPFIHSLDQASLIAAENAVPNTSHDSGINLTVLKSRAVDGAGLPLMPGARINWDYGPHSLDLVCRVTARRLRIGQTSDTLTLVRERGAFPRPYVAPVDVRVLPTPDVPGVIDVGDVRLWFLPTGFGPDRQIVPLVNRTKRTIYRADLHFSPSGSAPWEVILDSRFFVAKCAVAGAGISAADATVRVTSASVDFARFAAQSTVAQVDDTLLLLIEDEVVSVGAITVVSAGTYDLAILRGRRGTVAAAHAATALSWLFYRSELRSAEHADFYRVRDGGNVYNAGIATKYFKIQLFTIESDGLAKPDDPGISLVLEDLTADVLTGYTVILTSEAHTVAADSGGTVIGGELGAGGTARTAVQVLRGSTPLTAVAAGPNSDQFSIALGALVATTATKENNTTVRADTLTANTGSIEITVSVAGAFSVAKKFVLTLAKAGITGAPGAPGADGAPGAPGATGGPGAPGATGLSGLDGSTTFYGVAASPPNALRVGDVWFVTDLAFEMRRATSTGTAGWVSALTGASVFEIIGGTTYIKRAAVREVDAGVILAGTVNVALALGTLGTFTASSGANRFFTDNNGSIFGDPAGPHFAFANVGSSAQLVFRDGAANKGFIDTSDTYGTILDLGLGGGGGKIQGVRSLSSQFIHAFSSADPRGTDAPLSSNGGCWVAQSLDVGANGYFAAALAAVGEVSAGNFLLNASGKIAFTNYANYFAEYYGINIHTQGATWPVRIDGALVMGAVGYGSNFTSGNIYDSNADQILTSRQTGYSGSGTLSLAQITAILRGHGLCD